MHAVDAHRDQLGDGAALRVAGDDPAAAGLQPLREGFEGGAEDDGRRLLHVPPVEAELPAEARRVEGVRIGHPVRPVRDARTREGEGAGRALGVERDVVALALADPGAVAKQVIGSEAEGEDLRPAVGRPAVVGVCLVRVAPMDVVNVYVHPDHVEVVLHRRVACAIGGRPIPALPLRALQHHGRRDRPPLVAEAQRKVFVEGVPSQGRAIRSRGGQAVGVEVCLAGVLHPVFDGLCRVHPELLQAHAELDGVHLHAFPRAFVNKALQLLGVPSLLQQHPRNGLSHGLRRLLGNGARRSARIRGTIAVISAARGSADYQANQRQASTHHSLLGCWVGWRKSL
mmetsp:Transcript_103176/g.274308  ORF Transcript_103176/g.274308 Transcript_103176/m.274308 type:complete len:342 (+) Transcript_103176:509-1534(+)